MQKMAEKDAPQRQRSPNGLAVVRALGLSPKAAKIYAAGLELGEATVQQLAEASGVRRTTIYYVLNELLDEGALVEIRRNKRIHYIAEDPSTLLQRIRERLSDAEDGIIAAAARKGFYRQPRLYFLYGPAGFKRIWDMIFSSASKQFRIITDAASFTDFVREKYILETIIKKKKRLGISSRQIITDTPYNRKIVAKDPQENRVSKFLPARAKLPFTELITEDFVAMISPRWDDTLFVVADQEFSKTRTALFETLWDKL